MMYYFVSYDGITIYLSSDRLVRAREIFSIAPKPHSGPVPVVLWVDRVDGFDIYDTGEGIMLIGYGHYFAVHEKDLDKRLRYISRIVPANPSIKWSYHKSCAIEGVLNNSKGNISLRMGEIGYHDDTDFFLRGLS